MWQPGRRAQVLATFLACTWLLARPSAAFPAELKPKTVEAFEHYIQVTEAQSDEQLRRGSPFLWVDCLPEPRRQAAYTQLRQGQVVIEHLETHEEGKPIKVPDGLIHHWIAVSFIPSVTIRQTLALIQDYDHHQDFYKPDVVRSKLLSANGNDFKVYLRLYRKAIVTAVFNAEFEARYFPLDATRVHSRSYSTRIAEVENPGESNEREKSVGHDRGFLWRLYSYWRFQEKDGGVYIQLESIALSRNVPAIFAWLVNPYLKSIPKQYLSHLMEATRAALNKMPGASTAR